MVHDSIDLERALTRLLVELEPDVTAPVQEKLAETKLARKLGRVSQH
ncbi:MAG TPA: hypothetical protein VKA61_00775 [Sphingomicrobium sp.]|nr:hypothetical protein [Sphingomicrobium sp.]